MNPVGQLITFIASVSIILYFLLIGYFLRRIMIAVEKLAGINQSKTIVCKNCGKTINMGTDFDEPFIDCPACKTKIVFDQPGIFLKPEQQKEEVFP